MGLLEFTPPHTAVLAGAVLVALLVDRWLGEPPAPWHPVVWMGHYLNAVGRRISRASAALARPAVEFWSGALAWSLGALVMVVIAAQVSAWLAGLAWIVQTLALGLLLKPLMAWQMLRGEVVAVEAALGESLEAGRQRVAFLVSRDVRQLDETQVREAAVSTLAENLNDSVVAPLFWFAFAGLPGAALYRFANTADAMWGYLGDRQGRDWTWMGKWAARADDVLSWLPARITALLLAVPTAWKGWARVSADARLTPSPNGGWPMAAMAVGLGIRLGKPGVYTLNRLGRAPQALDTSLALRRCGQVVCLLALAAAVTIMLQWRSLP